MIEIGYVLSGCDQRIIPFVVKEGYKVVVNGYYFIKHPLSGDRFTPVLLRVFKITPYNPEMGLGGFGPIAGKKGEKARYGKGLEYDVAFAEALGYIREDGKWVRLECAPGTWDPVYQPEPHELQEFYMEIMKGGRRDCLNIRIGRLKGSNVPIYLDLNSIAKGHMFVAGMSVAYYEPIVYMHKGWIRVEEIGRFVDRYFTSEEEGEVELNDDIYVPSFDMDKLELKWHPVRSVIRHRYEGPMIKIELEDGRSVTVTPSHSVFTIRDSKVEAVEANSLNPGDRILVPLSIPRPASYIEVLDLSSILQPRDVYVETHQSFYRRNNDRYNVDDVEGCISIEGEHLPFKLFIDKDIARLIAYYILFGCSYSDGVVFRLPRSIYDEESIVSAARSFASTVDVSIEKYDEYVEVRLKSKILSLFFKALRSIDPDAYIPRFIFNLKPEIIESFLEPLLKSLSLGLIDDERLLSDILYLKLIANGYRNRDSSTNDLSLARISRIDIVEYGYRYVYDLSVPGCENFVAGIGGVSCHNTRSGKSSFVVSLIAKASRMEPQPRFIVLDRRCEYTALTKFGGKVYPYRFFLPKISMLKGKLIASRLNLDPSSSAGRLVVEAVESLKARGEDVNRVSLLREVNRIAPMIGSRNNSYSLNLIRWALERRGAFLDEEYKYIDIVDVCRSNPIVIVDLSVDTDIDAQHIAIRHIVSRVVDYALSRREQGDFAVIFVVEEAQYFTPEKGLKIEVGNPEKIGVDKELIEAVSQAGGYNVGFIFITQRPAYISKCLSGNMMVQLYDGEVIAIKELYEKIREKGGLILESDEETIIYPNDNIQLSTLSKDLSCINTRLIAISRRRGLRKLLRIKTFDGYILECSPEHRVYLLDENGNLVEKEAGSLKPGEQLILVHPATQPSQPNSNHFIDEDASPIHTSHRRKEVFNIAYNGNWSGTTRVVHESMDIPYFTIRDRVQNLQDTLGYQLNLAEDVRIGENILSTRTKLIKTPAEVIPDLGEFLGLIVSKGNDALGSSYTLKFTDKDLYVLSRFKYLCNNLFEITPEDDSNHNSVKIYSNDLMEVLEYLGYKILAKVRDRETPLCIQKASNEIVSAFLKGLFEGGGYISLKNRRIGFITTSEKLAYQIVFLMFRLGFKPRMIVRTSQYKGKSYRVFEICLSDKSEILMFRDKIGFISEDKKSKLDTLVSMIECKHTRKKYDYVNLSPSLLDDAIIKVYGSRKYHYLWYDLLKRRRKLSMYRLRKICEALSETVRINENSSLKILKRIADAPISFSTIKDIEEFQAEETYDIETEDRSFVAGGAPFLVHNSIISQCNTIACFRLMSGNDQEAILKYTEYGNERLSDYLPGLADHEALFWGLGSLIPFPVAVEVEVEEYPRKARITAKEAWINMGKTTVEVLGG